MNKLFTAAVAVAFTLAPIMVTTAEAGPTRHKTVSAEAAAAAAAKPTKGKAKKGTKKAQKAHAHKKHGKKHTAPATTTNNVVAPIAQ